MLQRIARRLVITSVNPYNDQGDPLPSKSIAEVMGGAVERIQKRALPITSTEKSQRGGLDIDVMYARIFFGMGGHFDLTPTEAFLLALVHSLSLEGKAWCYMSQEKMAQATNVSLQTVNGLLEKLRSNELLEKGSRHQKWDTIQWKLSPKALDRLRYIQDEIAKRKRKK